MPRPDPVPNHNSPIARRFWRVLRVLVPLSLVVAAIAVLVVARGGGADHIHMLVATGIGIFMMTLVGTALMSLVFLSASSGHDDAAADHRHDVSSQVDD